MTTEQLGVPGPPEPHERERRVAIIPIAIAVGVLLLAGALALVIAGLAARAPVAAPTPTPSVIAPAADVPAAPTPTEAPRADAGPNECVDERGDGSGIDIDSVGLSVEGDRLRVVFVLAEPLPEGDSSLELYAESGDARYQLAALWDDGDLHEFFAYRLPDSATDDDDAPDDRDHGGSNDRGPRNGDDGEEDRTDLKKRDISNEGSVVIAFFPAKVLDALGEEFQWYAYATAGNDPADSCSGADGSLVPFSR